MPWKPIDSAPRDGKTIKVRDSDWPKAYWARYWTKAMLEADEYPDTDPHGWYEWFPDFQDDGDVLVDPIQWYDPSPD